MIKIGISMIKNWYSNYLYFNDQHFKKPMVPFVSWSLLSLGPFWPWSLLSLGPFWPWSLLAMVPFGSWSLLAGPFWPVPFGQSLLAWSLLTSNKCQELYEIFYLLQLSSRTKHMSRIYKYQRYFMMITLQCTPNAHRLELPSSKI